MLPSDDDCDDCVPSHLRKQGALAALWAALPFIVTFALVAALSLKKLFPFLSGGSRGYTQSPKKLGQNGMLLPQHQMGTSNGAPRKETLVDKLRPTSSVSKLGLVQITFATNMGLAAVLVELLLCEISNSLSSTARQQALNFTLPVLMVSLIIVAPALEIHSILKALGFSFASNARTLLRIAWVSEGLTMLGWLLFFWYVGQWGLFLREQDVLHASHSFGDECLERIGIIGISLMASLSGFAAVSAPLQAFGMRSKPVTQAEISKKELGLESAEDMLQAKKSRLRALERRSSDTVVKQGMFSRVIGSFRGSSESQERSLLQLEINGLETMRMSMNNSLYSLRARQAAQARAKTALGRAINSFAYAFAVYCLYRLATTSASIIRRWLIPWYTWGSGTDPVTNILALLTTHWDATLDVAAWTRQISFLLSGFMLLASFNSALQTFLLFGRAFPSLLSAFHANLALVVSQISATYVISSALLLRSNLPREVGSVISEALGAPLEPRRVDAWFEGWFLCSALLTATGIWVGRKIKGHDDSEGGSRPGDVEMGKIS